ncbi:hypothetical protein [Mechercharimyces sp. CAU 1602]|uniref:hypothetical protein n=1 Tax=Mechercharimyces sp. CAU 1602 TaxID=2973933 RepID=UPI002161B905|nr:hypothetical protein [Mechercharimyces sp. CAU 1602]MCS1352620.1 hypothetical protein [Mechercharimyces sp. CAU 1602]
MFETISTVRVQSYHSRIRMRIPEQYSGCSVLISPSGQFGKLDENGAEGELEFYNQVTNQLMQRNVGIIEFDHPLRSNLDEPADDHHLHLRMSLLREVIRHASLEHTLVYLGVSLGAHVLLDVPELPGAGMILIGAVFEPTDASQKRRYHKPLHLIYGSEDYIGYGEDLNSIEIISPEEYIPWTVQNLKDAGFSAVTPHILLGYGHTLAKEGPTNEFPDQKVGDIVHLMMRDKAVKK